MSASTIKEFLVSLGYKVDSSSERRFVGGVTNATDVVNKLGSALKVLAAGATVYGAVKWMDNLSKSMEGLYYNAQRTGSGVRQLQAFGYAASQMGSSVEQAFNAAQAMHQWMVNNPSSEAILRQNLRINTRDANGNMASGEDILQRVGKSMQGMPAWRQNTISQQLGIPLELRQSLLQQGQMQVWQAQYNAMLAKAGLDPDKAATNGKNFAQGARSLGAAFDIAGSAIGSALMGHDGSSGIVGRFRDIILSRVPQITEILNKLAGAAVVAFGKLLDYLAGVNWDETFKRIGDFFTWLTGLNTGEMISGLKTIAGIFGALFAASMVSNILRLVPALASVTGFLVAAAGALGYIAGTHISNAIEGTPVQKGIGTLAAHVMSALGSKDATDALMANQPGFVGGHVSNERVKQLASLYRSRKAAGGSPGDTLGMRNNNAGNLRPVGGSGFQQFGSAQDGLNALGHQLMLYYSGKSAAAGHHKLQTIGDIIKTYAPPSENNTAAYISAVSSALGVKSGDHLDLNDPTQLAKLMAAIVHHENGRNPYSSEMLLKAAHSNTDSPGMGGASPTLNAKTDIHVYGSADPNATAKATAGQQHTVNQRSVRDLQQAFG